MKTRILIRLLVLFLIAILSACQPNQTTTNSSDPKNTVSPTATTTPTNHPPPENKFPFDWPITPPTADQIEEGRICDLTALQESRYPENLSLSDLPQAYSPETACDWAVLAASFGKRIEQEQDMPEEGLAAFYKTIELNPALAFNYEIYGSFFGRADFVKPPTLPDSPISSVTIIYEWNGLGEPVSFSIDAEVPETGEYAAFTGSVFVNNAPFYPSYDNPNPPSGNVSGSIHAELIRNLELGFSNLFPSNQLVHINVCFDNYPEWDVTITYQNGEEINLTTNESNFLHMGGPWQTEIDGQTYIQYSPDFTIQLGEIIDALNLPTGSPTAMSCFPEEGLYNAAYPE